MDLPRTFVGFCSTDAACYQEMTQWKAREGIAFEFCSYQMDQDARSGDEVYVKEHCREKLKYTGAYIMLIGRDTLSRDRHVMWGAQVARTKGCRMIGVNLNHKRQLDAVRTPAVMQNIGALFVPFCPHAIQAALGCDVRRDNQNYELTDEWYASRGYEVTADSARLIKAPSAEEVQ